MYTLVTAIAKSLFGDERWSTVDISNIPLDKLYSNYSEVIATLTNPYLTAPVALNLANVRPGIAGETITFDQYLTNLGNGSLPTTNTLPVLNPTYAHYADAFAAGYNVAPISPVASLTSEIPSGEKTWLYLTRPNTNYELFYKTCLVNINGFYHLTDTDNTGIYVVDGMKSCNLSHQNQIGIYSFNGVGNLTFIPIKSGMIYKQNTRQNYLNHCFVNLGVDITQKTVMLVLGGYLHMLDNKTFYPVGTDSIFINFANLPFLARYYESKKYLDLSSLPLERTSRNSNQVSIANFFSDANIEAYLTLSQSFFIVMDNDDIFINTLPVRVTKNPDMFISYIKPEYPLIVGVGKVSNYWYEYDDHQWSLNCHDSFKHNLIYETVDLMAQVSVDNREVPFKPVEQSPAYFLQLGTDII